MNEEKKTTPEEVGPDSTVAMSGDDEKAVVEMTENGAANTTTTSGSSSSNEKEEINTALVSEEEEGGDHDEEVKGTDQQQQQQQQHEIKSDEKKAHPIEEEKKIEQSPQSKEEAEVDLQQPATAAAVAAAAAVASTTTDGVAQEEQQQQEQEQEQSDFKHVFEAGDHVIRWEMLPIVWPIQIHGIVLEVGKNYVQICDFGLTAQPRDDIPAEDAEAAVDAADGTTTTTSSSSNGKPTTDIKRKRFAAAWEKVKPPDNTKKNRITVHIITEQDELKKWSKVHYGRNLLSGFGVGNNIPGNTTNIGEHDEDNNVNDNGEHHNEDHSSPTNNNNNNRTLNRKHPVLRDKVGPWWNNLKSKVGDRLHHHHLHHRSHGSKDDDADVSNHDDVDTPPPSPTKDENGKNYNNNNSNKNNKNKLPKSDPPKLVLARTRFLLEHGESIMPPYHVFHSNSECIAVFCKTGYWRTLQASVFLHSTAIGNAKSSMAVTLGVAASVPLLAPAIAGIGLAMVGAPYVILNQSKGKWNEATAKLTDAFWAQAPNEVFVECIEKWSSLCDDGKNKDEEEIIDGSNGSGRDKKSNEEEEDKSESTLSDQQNQPMDDSSQAKSKLRFFSV